jgi:hypothetical protein
MPKSKKQPRPRSKVDSASSFQHPVIAVTKEELHFALMAAAGVANGQTPRQSFQSKFEEAVDQGQLDPNKSYLRLTDARPNHMAFAILEAFPEKTPENEERRRSLLWRVIFAFPEIASDPRFEQYTHEENGEHFIEEAILEAAATTPMSAGKETPVDEVFRRAAELLRQEQGKSTD